MRKTALVLAALMLAVPAAAQQAPAGDGHAGHAGHGAPAGEARQPAFTLDTPIRDLLADARAAAVLEKHIPGVSQDPRRPQFEAMSLKQVQPFSEGMITDAMLAAIDTDLKAL